MTSSMSRSLSKSIGWTSILRLLYLLLRFLKLLAFLSFCCFLLLTPPIMPFIFSFDSGLNTGLSKVKGSSFLTVLIFLPELAYLLGIVISKCKLLLPMSWSCCILVFVCFMKSITSFSISSYSE